MGHWHVDTINGTDLISGFVISNDSGLYKIILHCEEGWMHNIPGIDLEPEFETIEKALYYCYFNILKIYPEASFMKGAGCPPYKFASKAFLNAKKDLDMECK